MRGCDDAYPQLLESLVRSVCRDSPLIAHPRALDRRTLVHDVIQNSWRKVQRAVRACGEAPTPEQLHALRIKVKRCRYAAEAVAHLYGRRQRERATARTGLREARSFRRRRSRRVGSADRRYGRCFMAQSLEARVEA